MWKTYQRGVCIIYSWPAMFGKLRTFRKCYYMYFQECLFKSTSTPHPPCPHPRKFWNPSSKSFEIGQIILTAPINKAVFWLCFKQSAGSLEPELWAEALWHGEVLQLIRIRHRSNASACASAASGSLARGERTGYKQRFAFVPWHFDFLRLWRPGTQQCARGGLDSILGKNYSW